MYGVREASIQGQRGRYCVRDPSLKEGWASVEDLSVPGRQRLAFDQVEALRREDKRTMTQENWDLVVYTGVGISMMLAFAVMVAILMWAMDRWG